MPVLVGALLSRARIGGSSLTDQRKVAAALADSVGTGTIRGRQLAGATKRSCPVGKMIVYAGMTVGSLLGAYLPVVLLHASALRIVSLVGGTVGAVVGLWAGYKGYQYLGI
jgi:hypothetical protein